MNPATRYDKQSLLIHIQNQRSHYKRILEAKKKIDFKQMQQQHENKMMRRTHSQFNSNRNGNGSTYKNKVEYFRERERKENNQKLVGKINQINSKDGILMAMYHHGVNKHKSVHQQTLQNNRSASLHSDRISYLEEQIDKNNQRLAEKLIDVKPIIGSRQQWKSHYNKFKCLEKRLTKYNSFNMQPDVYLRQTISQLTRNRFRQRQRNSKLSKNKSKNKNDQIQIQLQNFLHQEQQQTQQRYSLANKTGSRKSERLKNQMFEQHKSKDRDAEKIEIRKGRFSTQPRQVLKQDNKLSEQQEDQQDRIQVNLYLNSKNNRNIKTETDNIENLDIKLYTQGGNQQQQQDQTNIKRFIQSKYPQRQNKKAQRKHTTHRVKTYTGTNRQMLIKQKYFPGKNKDRKNNYTDNLKLKLNAGNKLDLGNKESEKFKLEIKEIIWRGDQEDQLRDKQVLEMQQSHENSNGDRQQQIKLKQNKLQPKQQQTNYQIRKQSKIDIQIPQNQ